MPVAGCSVYLFTGAVGGYDSEELRAEAISLLHSAWTNNSCIQHGQITRWLLRQNYRGGNGRARLENVAGYRELANSRKPVASIEEERDVFLSNWYLVVVFSTAISSTRD
jgi:hypothetical protein